MPTDPSGQPTKSTVLEIKGGSFTLPMIRLFGANMDAVGDQLAEKIEQAPDFFRNTPVVIDLQELADQRASVDLTLLVSVLRGQGVVPIGIQGVQESQLEAARAMDLAVLSDGKVELKSVKSEAPREPEERPEPKATPSITPATRERTTRVINQPVRSGQRIYAGGSDLIVLAQVSNGAEIMADGNIHVYGTLNGRALAGVKGNTESRIFCMNLQAELISIAGHYQISERLDDALRGKPVQIYLDNEKSLIIDDL